MSAKARSIVAKARAQAHAIVSLARLKRKEILARARTKPGPRLSNDDEDSPEAIAQRRADFSNIGPNAYRARTVKKADQQAKRAEVLTQKEVKRAKPQINVMPVLGKINSFYVSDGEPSAFRMSIGALRSQVLDSKREVDFQLTELARVGLIRLLTPRDYENATGRELPLGSARNGYPSDMPRYYALEKLRVSK